MFKKNKKVLVSLTLLILSLSIMTLTAEALDGPLFYFSAIKTPTIFGDGNIGSPDEPHDDVILNASSGSAFTLSPTVKEIYSTRTVFNLNGASLTIPHSIKIENISTSNVTVIHLRSNNSSIEIADDTTMNFSAKASVSGISLEHIQNTANAIIGDNFKMTITGGSGHKALSIDVAGGPSTTKVVVGDNAYFSIMPLYYYDGSSQIMFVSQTYDAYAEMVIGNNATIFLEGVSSSAIRVIGENQNFSKVILGDNASISVVGNGSYALHLTNLGHISIGKNANISVSGDGSHAVFFELGANLSIDEGAIINVKGKDSSVFYFQTRESMELSFKDITAYSENSYLVHCQAGYRPITITFSGNSSLKGTILSYLFAGSAHHLNLILEDNSHWVGYFMSNFDNIDLSGISSWTITNSTYIANLTMSDSSALIFSEDSFVKLVVGSAKISDNPSLSMKASFSEDTQGDLLIINEVDDSSNGELRLDFYSVSGQEDRSSNIIMVNNDYDIPIAHSEYGFGSRVYTLERESVDGTTVYYLQADIDGVLNPVMGKISSGYIGMLQTAKAFDDIITHEGNRKVHGLFMHGHYKYQIYDKLIFTFDSEEYDTIPFKQKISGGIIGYNWGIDDIFLFGAFIGGSHTEQLFEDSSEGIVTILTGGIQSIIDTKGLDIHTYVRISHNAQTSKLLTLQQTHRYGNTSALGLSVSVSLAYPIKFEDMQLTLTPTGRAFFTHIGEHDFYVYNGIFDDAEIRLVVASESGFQTWLGATVTKAFNLTNDTDLNINLAVNWVFNEGTSIAFAVGEDEFMASIDKHLLALKLSIDLNVKVPHTNHVFVDLNFLIGKTMKEVFGIKIGGSWNF